MFWYDTVEFNVILHIISTVQHEKIKIQNGFMLFLKCIDSFCSILEIVICVERGIKILCVECEMNTCNGIEMYVNWKKGVDKTGNFMWTETSWSL